MNLQKLETLLEECKRNREQYPEFLVDDNGKPVPHRWIAQAIFSHVIDNIENALESDKKNNIMRIEEIRRSKAT